MAMMEQVDGRRGPTAQSGNIRVTTFNVTKFSTTTTNSLLPPCPSAYSLLLIEFLFTDSPFASNLFNSNSYFHSQLNVFMKPTECVNSSSTIRNFAMMLMLLFRRRFFGLENSVVFGRAIKNEHLALGTFATAFGGAYFATRGGSKTAAAKPKTVQEAKESVPISATSS